jgi:hypothetical protein
MPHLNVLRFAGAPDDLLARKERYVDPVTARVAARAGGLAHITAKTPDGLLVLNLMADGGGQMAPEVAEALRESGLPEPTVERYEVTRFVLAPGAAAATTE